MNEKLLEILFIIQELLIFKGQLKVINQSIYFNGDRIFFSGADSYSNYGRDFGNGSYKESKLEIETLLASIEANGGNSVTVYIHVDGQELPHFDSLIGNYTESLIADLKEFLNVAEKHNLFVILSLWNGYLNRPKISQLITDDSFQRSYIDKVITPMATALSNHKALAIWQIIKGPEGMVAIGKKDPDPCFDTSGTKFYNTQWKDSSLTMKEVLRFINQMSSALHTVSPSKLVTVSIGNIEGMMSFNYFTKDCLKKAGGHDNGYLDIYVLGSIKINEEYSDYIPLQKTSFELKLDKPVIIADVSTNSTNSSSLADVYLKFLKFDYSGCLALGYRDLQKSVNEGLKSIDQRIKKIVFNEK
jgi:mannan endo-1,4-beta-mannosidase